MKFFVISDIHSFYDEIKKALDESGFDPQNSQHMLISCGDNFDRGRQSQEILDYLLSLPNAVFVKGNHESLFIDCCQRGFAWGYDFSNGTHQTICDLDLEAMNFPNACMTAYHKVKPLLNKMVDYFETEHYIFVHSWIACNTEDDYPKFYTRDRKFSYNPNWRNAHYSDWETARWGNPFNMAQDGLNQTGKIIIHGHWHNSTGWFYKNHTSEWGEDACFDICEHNNCIGIDACTAYSGKVNVLVIEDELI